MSAAAAVVVAAVDDDDDDEDVDYDDYDDAKVSSQAAKGETEICSSYQSSLHWEQNSVAVDEMMK